MKRADARKRDLEGRHSEPASGSVTGHGRMAYGGKSVYGARIGILMLDMEFPRIPGDMGNALTWPFPVLFRTVRGADRDWIHAAPREEVFQAFCDDALGLVAEGADGILVAQPSDLLYGGRRSGPAKVNVGAKKKNVALGIFPASDADAVMDIVGDDFPEYRPFDNVLAAGLSGPGMAVHPIPMIMNAVKIDQLGAYTYTSYDITPSVARVIEGLDTERLAILAALGIEASSFKDVLNEYYGAEGADFHETVNNVPGYRKQKAPADFQDRYITEEIPTQMVPAALIGNALGVATPIFNATVSYASAINGTDYWTEGWTLEKLGLAGMGRDAILDYLRTGEK